MTTPGSQRWHRASRTAMIVMVLLLSGCGGATGPRAVRHSASARTTETPPPLAFKVGEDDIWVLDRVGASPRQVTQGDQPRWTPDHRMLVVSRNDPYPPGGGLPSRELWLVSASGTDIRRLTSLYPGHLQSATVGGQPPYIAVYTTGTGIWRVGLNGKARRQITSTQATDLAISPDGSQLAVVLTPGHGLASLDVMSIDGSARKTAFNGTPSTCQISTPSWSPDGKWIAFTLCTDQGGGNDLQAIWLIRPDGTGLRKLAQGIDPTWSPGGQWIAFQNSTLAGVGLSMIHPDGTGQTQIIPYADTTTSTGASYPSW